MKLFEIKHIRGVLNMQMRNKGILRKELLTEKGKGS